MEIYQSEILTLLGVNGAGKTTLSSIIATILRPTAGNIFAHGQSIYTDIPAYRLKIGYCPQKPNLNEQLTVRDNLRYSGLYFGMTNTEIAERITYVSHHLKLNAYLDRMPRNYQVGMLKDA